uniref:Uncharacterized protein n=1 Tax=Glossina palpalis gambiensis TaxID=67801 RepID=A0A1B0BKI2_9MUSC
MSVPTICGRIEKCTDIVSKVESAAGNQLHHRSSSSARSSLFQHLIVTVNDSPIKSTKFHTFNNKSETPSSSSSSQETVSYAPKFRKEIQLRESHYIKSNKTEKSGNLLLIQKTKNSINLGTKGNETSVAATTITATTGIMPINNVVTTCNTTTRGSQVPSISIIPLTSATTVRSFSSASQLSASSSFVAAEPKKCTLVKNVSGLVVQQRSRPQEQFNQTEKCTILKFDVVRKSSVATSTIVTSTLTSTSSSTASTASDAPTTETTLVIPSSAIQIDTQDFDDSEDRPQQDHHQSSQIITNQPIIVKIEPTQAFHIVDESDTRVLSLPLTDSDKVGASWIDLKDLAGLQSSAGSTLLDVCFEPITTVTNTATNTDKSTTTATKTTSTAKTTIDAPTGILITKRQGTLKPTETDAPLALRISGSESSSSATVANKATTTITSPVSTTREQYSGPSTSGAMTEPFDLWEKALKLSKEGGRGGDG